MRFLIAKTLTIAFLLCPPLFSTDAPMFRGDPQHSGVYNSSAIVRFSRVKWKFHTKGMVFSSPAIAGGVVYVGSNDGNLYAVDLASGTQKWKFATKSRIPSSPAVADGVVYFVSYDAQPLCRQRRRWKDEVEVSNEWRAALRRHSSSWFPAYRRSYARSL